MVMQAPVKSARCLIRGLQQRHGLEQPQAVRPAKPKQPQAETAYQARGAGKTRRPKQLMKRGARGKPESLPLGCGKPCFEPRNTHADDGDDDGAAEDDNDVGDDDDEGEAGCDADEDDDDNQSRDFPYVIIFSNQ